MFRDRQREQRSAGSPRKGNWTMAALRMNGGEEKEEKAMEFTGKQIQEARERIAPFVDETPLLRLKALDAYLGCQVYVKAECMQKTGAFKFRGSPKMPPRSPEKAPPLSASGSVWRGAAP